MENNEEKRHKNKFNLSPSTQNGQFSEGPAQARVDDNGTDETSVSRSKTGSKRPVRQQVFLRSQLQTKLTFFRPYGAEEVYPDGPTMENLRPLIGGAFIARHFDTIRQRYEKDTSQRKPASLDDALRLSESLFLTKYLPSLVQAYRVSEASFSDELDRIIDKYCVGPDGAFPVCRSR